MNILKVFGKTTTFVDAASMDYLGGKHGPCSTAVIFRFCVLLQHMMTVKLGTNRTANVCLSYTECPTRHRTQHFFNNSNTNEYIATRFEQEYVCCVRNEEECVCSVPNA